MQLPRPIAADQETLLGDRYSGYPGTRSVILGGLSFAFGLLCIAFESAALYNWYDYASAIAHGIWCGAIFVITGHFGITAGQVRSKCTITTFMSFSIISTIFSAVLFALGVYGATAAYQNGLNCVGAEGSAGTVTSNGSCVATQLDENFNVAIAMNSMLAIVAVFEAVVAILGTIISASRVFRKTSIPPLNITGNTPVIKGFPPIITGYPAVRLQESTDDGNLSSPTNSMLSAKKLPPISPPQTAQQESASEIEITTK